MESLRKRTSVLRLPSILARSCWICSSFFASCIQLLQYYNVSWSSVGERNKNEIMRNEGKKRRTKKVKEKGRRIGRSQ
jgi:hypothetical protein